jgi:hypothetical protein
MRYQVPQFVDIEDKIIGPLTLKQFLIYIVSGVLLVPVYLATDISLFITLAIPVMGLAALFAHFKLHGRSFFTILGHAGAFVLHGQLFLWRRSGHEGTLAVRGLDLEELDELGVEAGSTLSDRARALETVGNVVDEDVEDPLDQVIKSEIRIPKSETNPNDQNLK